MYLELPQKQHEKDYLEMIQEFTDIQEEIIPWSLGLKEWEDYEAFLTRIKNNSKGINMKPWRSRATLYFLIDDHDRIVGAEHIRHELNDTLRFEGGNIGYGIRPNERKKWYATSWLKLALEKCKEMGMDKVLITCDKDNIWSVKSIINNWWILDSEYENRWVSCQRYRIPIK